MLVTILTIWSLSDLIAIKNLHTSKHKQMFIISLKPLLNKQENTDTLRMHLLQWIGKHWLIKNGKYYIDVKLIYCTSSREE